MRITRGALALSTLALGSCTADDTDTSGETGLVNTVVEEADGITAYSPEFEVPPGDSFTCIYFDYKTTREMSVISGDGLQGKGGHHVLIYYADTPREPGVHTCTDEEMTNLHQVSGSAGEGGTQVLALPDGLALKVPPGKQLVMEAHYINSTDASYKVKDWAKIVEGDASKVKDYVNYFVTNDEAFELSPSAATKRVSECTATRDFQMALALPHMHELGSHFTLEHFDAAGETLGKLIDVKWALSFISHPPALTWDMTTPYMIKKGEKLRQTCEWNNSTTNPVIFPREMCVAFFYYWPGDGDIQCEMVEIPQ